MSLQNNLFEQENFNYKLSNKCYSLARCNPKLSGNFKILVDDKSIYLDSIDAVADMSDTKLKTFVLNPEKPFRSNIKNYFNNLSNKIAIWETPDQRVELVNDYTDQRSSIYSYGCYNDTSKDIDKSHRFFAPMYLDPESKMPDGFVIMVVERDQFGQVLNVKKTNTELVYVHDFRTSKLGQILRSHQKEMAETNMGVSVNYKDATSVTGIDINRGVISEKDAYTNIEMQQERTIAEFEAFITKIYEQNEMIDGRYINMEFCFDLDLTQQQYNDTWLDVVGMYVYLDDVQGTDTALTDDLFLAFTNEWLKADGVIVPDEPLYDAVETVKFDSISIEYPPMAVIKFNNIPNLSQRFILEFGGNQEVNLPITTDLQASTIAETIDLIVDALVQSAIDNSLATSLKFRRFGDNELHIISDLTHPLYETITITSTPLVCEVLEPYIGTFTGNDPNLLGTNTKTILTTRRVIDSTIDAIRFPDGLIVVPEKAYRYLGRYATVTDTDLSTQDTGSRDMTLLRERDVAYYRVRNMEHRKIDFNRDKSYHDSPLDFDLDLYQTYLISRINDSDYTGRLTPPVDPLVLADYKTEVTNIVNSYFDNIDLPSEQLLVGDIDLSTFEISPTNNEYKPLIENEQAVILQYAPYDFINKWSIRDGNDVTNNPQRLNASLRFREDSFTPSLTFIGRDLRKFTHSWYLIGSGKPIWYQGVDISGYTQNQVLVSDVVDIANDPYSNGDIDEFSYVRLDPQSEVASVYFRGVRLILPPEFDGYKFACILFPQEPVSQSDRDIKFLRNDTFKTLTLAVSQFIPEPVLTGLEESGVYYLDRSVLYFSSGGNATDVALASLGEEPISLLLFENTLPKSYVNQNVGNQWVYNDNGTNIAHIKLNPAVNSFDLRTMIGVGSDFQIRYADTSNPTPNNFGMEITFRNVIEVGSDYFWCELIEVEYNDGITQTTFEIVADYVADNNILFNSNTHATAESVSRYNAVFDRTISNSLGGDRYAKISTNEIVDYLNGNLVPVVDENGGEKTINAFSSPPDVIAHLWSLTIENQTLNLTRFDEVNRFEVKRPSYYYDPVTNILIDEQVGQIEIVYNDIVWLRKATVGFNTALTNNFDRRNNRLPLIPYNEGNQLLSKMFLYSNTNNIETFIDWIFDASEMRNYMSRTVSVQEEQNIEWAIVDGGFNIVDVLFSYGQKILNNIGLSQIDLSDPASYTVPMRLSGLNTQNLTEQDVKDYIIREFISTTLANIYRVVDVELNGVTYEAITSNNINYSLIAVDENDSDSGTGIINIIHG